MTKKKEKINNEALEHRKKMDNERKAQEMLEKATEDLLASEDEDTAEAPLKVDGTPYPEEIKTVIDMRPDPEQVAAEKPVVISQAEWASTIATLAALKAQLDAKEAGVTLGGSSPSVEIPKTPAAPPPPSGAVKLGTEKDPLMEDYEHTMSYNPGIDRWILETKHVQLPTSKGLKVQEWVGEPSAEMIAEAKKTHMTVLTAKYYEERSQAL